MGHEIHERIKEQARKMLYIENCIIKSRRAARGNGWMENCSCESWELLKVSLKKNPKKQNKTNPATNLFHSQPTEESQIRIIVFEGRMQ